MKSATTAFQWRRSRLQFSLLSVLIFQMFACVLLAWWVQPAHVVATALFEVTNRGGCFGLFTAPLSAEKFGRLKRAQLELVKSQHVLAAAVRDPAATATKILRDQEDPVRWLQNHVLVDYPQDGEILAIELPGVETQARELTHIVDAIATAYKNEIASNRRQRLFLNRDLLVHNLKHVEAEIRSKRDGRDLGQLRSLAANMSISLDALDIDHYGSYPIRQVQSTVIGRE